jgi:mRNA interferase MazF
MKRYEVYLISLDPSLGYEVKKTRPGVIISPDEMNDNIGTVIVAPMTTKSHDYPSRVRLRFMKKEGWIMLDQLRCIDKGRLVKKLGAVGEREIREIKAIIKEMLVD